MPYEKIFTLVNQPSRLPPLHTHLHKLPNFAKLMLTWQQQIKKNTVYKATNTVQTNKMILRLNKSLKSISGIDNLEFQIYLRIINFFCCCFIFFSGIGFLVPDMSLLVATYKTT